MSRRKIAELKRFEDNDWTGMTAHGVGAYMTDPNGGLTVIVPNPATGGWQLAGVGADRWFRHSLTVDGSLLVSGGAPGTEWHGWIEDGWVCD